MGKIKKKESLIETIRSLHPGEEVTCPADKVSVEYARVLATRMKKEGFIIKVNKINFRQYKIKRV